MNYRGIKPAHIITVLEGSGTEEKPYEEVEYVVTYEDVGGIARLITKGKIKQLSPSFEDFLSKDNNNEK